MHYYDESIFLQKPHALAKSCPKDHFSRSDAVGSGRDHFVTIMKILDCWKEIEAMRQNCRQLIKMTTYNSRILTFRGMFRKNPLGTMTRNLERNNKRIPLYVRNDKNGVRYNAELCSEGKISSFDGVKCG